jgi:hypothetical protein
MRRYVEKSVVPLEKFLKTVFGLRVNGYILLLRRCLLRNWTVCTAIRRLRRPRMDQQCIRNSRTAVVADELLSGGSGSGAAGGVRRSRGA